MRQSYKDITINSIYDQWQVIGKPKSVNGTYKVKCRCSCGKIKFVKTHNLLKYKSKSCGCIQQLNIGRSSKGQKAQNAVSPEHLAVTQLINQYRHSAKKRNLTYELTREQFKSLISQNCFYCDISPSNAKISKNVIFKYNGIDRVNNYIGYNINNCKPCCIICNTMKLDMNHEDFMEKIEKIIKKNKLIAGFSSKKLNAYHARAIATATQSHDIHTKVGALLINSKTGAVIAEGYNGFIRGALDDSLPTSRPEKYDYIIHAETNLLCNAVRSGVKTDEAIVYCTLSPCVKCVRMLWQAGISSFYFKEKYKDFAESQQMLDLNIELHEAEDNFFLMNIKPKEV